MPAPAPSPRTSGARSRRARPLWRSSRRTGPIRTRTSRSIGAPTAPNIRRSWRFQPWARIARYQTRSPGGGAMSSTRRRVSISVVGRRPVSVARPSSSGMPALSAATCSRRQRRAQADRVLALDAVARMEDAIGPRAVVGQDEQALRVLVEPADRVEPRRPRAAAPSGSCRGRSSTACRSRTVEVTPAGLWSSRYSGAAAAPMTRPSTAMTALSGSTCMPELGRPAVDRDPPVGDEDLARPPRRDARTPRGPSGAARRPSGGRRAVGPSRSGRAAR